MKIEGSNQELGALTGSVGSGEQAAIRKQIQVLTKELSQLERKVRPTKQDELKKKTIQKTIAELKEQLQRVKAAERREKQEKLEHAQSGSDEAQISDETGETLVERLKEAGKGRAVDELV